jgi:T3SS (YopN, CesT) and YbjN peptide-binding chaperone 1
MAGRGSLRARVEEMLKQVLGTKTLVTAPNGSWPLRRGSTTFWVDVLEPSPPPPPPMVIIFSPMLLGVRKTPELLDAINQMNVQGRFARAAWMDDRVMVGTELVADTLDPQELAVAIDAVGWLADTYDDELQAHFGGELPRLRQTRPSGSLSQEGLAAVMARDRMLHKEWLRTFKITADPLNPASWKSG